MTTSLEAEDAVAEWLGARFGAAAATYFNLETGISTVSIFRDRKFDSIQARAEVTAGIKHIEDCGLRIGSGRIEITKVKREDWKESWKRHFHPLEIGKTLLIKPSWSKKRPRKGQALSLIHI